MSKVLVTGGAGYIGSILVKELLLKGYDVKIFDKLIFGVDSLVDFRNKIELIQGDIRNFEESSLEDVFAVIHLAGFSNDPMADYDSSANQEVNTFGTRRVAEICAKKGIKRFLYASSASIYDQGISRDPTLQDEKNEVNPRNAYPLSKYNGEKEILKVMEEYPEFCPTILRQGTVFGYSPKMRFDLVVNTFVKDVNFKDIKQYFNETKPSLVIEQIPASEDVREDFRAFLVEIGYEKIDEVSSELSPIFIYKINESSSN